MNRIVFLIFSLFFLFFQSSSLYGGDAGDLVTAAYTGSIAHPPGYPLYSFLGYLVTHIPVGTVAWRAALLSSLPMAGACTVLFALLYKLTRNVIASFTSVTIFSVTYLIWLYAIVPEVFALNLLLTSLLMYVGYEFSIRPSHKKLNLIALLAGLGIAHHHIIVFSFPAVAVFLFQQKTYILRSALLQKIKTVLWGMAGLLPYIWAYIAGKRVAPLVWDDPVTIENFIRLVSRADYGSFQSGISFGQHIQSRFLQFPALLEFYIQDFTILGICIALFGVLYMMRKLPMKFIPLITGFLFAGPIYFFYASYLFTSNFHIATAERFLTPSYLFVAIFLGYGIYGLFEILKRFPRTVQLMSLFLILLIPTWISLSNYPKLSILKHDRTAENFGRDILTTVDENGIVLLQGDHPVFNTQYMYYTTGYRNDVKLIHFTKYINGTAFKFMDTYYPELHAPNSEDPVSNTIELIQKNYDTYPIYATLPLDLIPEEYDWVPEGLLYRLYRLDELPSYETVEERNQYLWESYQNPLDGSLGMYENLMLSNVVDYYSDASVRRGLYAIEEGEEYATAISYFDYATSIDPENGLAYYFRGESLTHLGLCDEALDSYEEGFEARPEDEQLYIESMITLHRDCYKDFETAEEWTTKLGSLLKQSEIQLQEL